MSRIILTYLLSLFFIKCHSQLNQTQRWQIVLKTNYPDSTFLFNDSKNKEFDENRLTYLGQITTENKKIFKVLKSSWIWGQSARGTGRIIFFNIKNQYVGEYYAGGLSDLPDTLIDNSLVFAHTEDNYCDKNLKTVINFEKGIPKKIFIKCKGKYGNIYSFTSQ